MSVLLGSPSGCATAARDALVVGSGQGRPVRAEQGCRGEHQGCYAGWRTLPQPADERVSRTPSAREEMKSCRLEGLDSTRNQCQRNQVSGTIRAGILGFCLFTAEWDDLGCSQGTRLQKCSHVCVCVCVCVRNKPKWTVLSSNRH